MTTALTSYSPLFTTLSDQVDNRGLHHSVLSADIFYHDGKWTQHSIAVVWDEDHDTRIIGFLEKLLEFKALKFFIGASERKGMLTLVLGPRHAKLNTSGLGLIGLVVQRALDEGLTDDDWSWSFAAPAPFIAPQVLADGHRHSYDGDNDQWGTMDGSYFEAVMAGAALGSVAG